jgi:hypothetical protein
LAFFEINPVFRKHYHYQAIRVDSFINLVNDGMSSEEESIIDCLKTGEFLLSVHAVGRMRQQSVAAADIRACGRTARSCLYRAQSATWRIDGEDLDGEMLTVICGFDEAAIVVTVF